MVPYVLAGGPISHKSFHNLLASLCSLFSFKKTFVAMYYFQDITFSFLFGKIMQNLIRLG